MDANQAEGGQRNAPEVKAVVGSGLGEVSAGLGMEISMDRPFKLEVAVKRDAWGRPGGESIIPGLVGIEEPGSRFAELWVGTHKNFPATVTVRGGPLPFSELIARDPEAMLGKRVAAEFNNQYPNLFKILTIAEPLSIQSHPDKSLAESLHLTDPEHYPDDNHTPEVAVAITEVTLLYGFRTTPELITNFRNTPELRMVVGEDLTSQLMAAGGEQHRDLLKSIYSATMTAPEDVLKAASDALVRRLQGIETREEVDNWALKAAGIYPDGDPGVFCFHLMNLGKLDPGQALFIGPNVPHAYLLGDLVETMANSDNVIRAGLTPKFRDNETLITSLTYAQGPIPILEAVAQAGFDNVAKYPLPAREFDVEKLTAGPLQQFSTRGGIQLLFCLEGSAALRTGADELVMGPGDAYVIPGCLDTYELGVKSGSLYRVSVPE